MRMTCRSSAGQQSFADGLPAPARARGRRRPFVFLAFALRDLGAVRYGFFGVAGFCRCRRWFELRSGLGLAAVARRRIDHASGMMRVGFR
jgi:hypothetical protein